MSPLQITTSVRSLKRIRRIASVLTQHGFGHVVERLQLARALPVWMRPKTLRDAATEATGTRVGRRLVRVCAELGPTFVKLGQLLTTRPDIIPADVLKELRALQDRVPPFDTQLAIEMIEADLGRPTDSVFESFDKTPIASGSIGQVYRAVTRDGDDVIVKVRRPGIEDEIRLDMHLLRWLAQSAEDYLPELRVYRPVMLVDEFEQVLGRELDYVNEASATARLEEGFKDRPAVRIPRIYWDLTSPRVLTMGALPGRNIGRLLAENDPHIDRPLLARRLTEAFFHQLFELGLFHADPHPGNILIEKPATIGLIDFGQVGLVSDELMRQMITVMYGGICHQVDVIVDVLADMNAFRPETDRARLEQSLRFLLDKYYGLPLKRLDLSTVFDEITNVLRRDLILPRDFVLVLKSLSTVGGVAQRVDPDFDLLSFLAPRLEGLVRQQWSRKRLMREGTIAAWHVLSMIRRAPREIRHGLRRLSSGAWQVRVRHENLDPLTGRIDRTGNRLALSALTASLVIGSSIVITSGRVLPLFGFNLDVRYLGLLGFAASGFFGLGLIWAILRSGRLH